MPTADGSVGDGEANALFRGLEHLPGLVLAVSGGPDSTALLVLGLAALVLGIRAAPGGRRPLALSFGGGLLLGLLAHLRGNGLRFRSMRRTIIGGAAFVIVAIRALMRADPARSAG